MRKDGKMERGKEKRGTGSGRNIAYNIKASTLDFSIVRKVCVVFLVIVCVCIVLGDKYSILPAWLRLVLWESNKISSPCYL